MADLTRLWKVGQEVVYIVRDFDGTAKHRGTIKEVHENYLIVDIPAISDHCYFEEGFNLGDLYPAYNF